MLHTGTKERYGGPGTATYPLPPDEPVIDVGGVRRVSLETAILSTAARDSRQTAVAAGDAALHRGLVTMSSLEEASVRLGRRASADGASSLHSTHAASRRARASPASSSPTSVTR